MTLRHNRLLARAVVTILIVSLAFVLPAPLSYGTEQPDDTAAAIQQILQSDEAYVPEKALSVSEETPKETSAVKAAALPGAEIAIDNPLIEATKKASHTVAVTLPGITVADDAAALAFATTALSLNLTRKRADSPLITQAYGNLVSDLFSGGIYTGDKLTEWRVWATNASDPAKLFTVPVVSAEQVDANTIFVEFDFDNDYFSGSATNTSNRNVYNSFIGSYDLDVVSGTAVSAPLVSDKMKFNIYKSYRTFPEVRAELEALQGKAKAKGFEFVIEELGKSEGGLPQYAVVFGKKGKSKQWLDLTNYAEEHPAELEASIDQYIGEVALPLYLNNVHPDESPGSDAIVNLLDRLINDTYIDTSYISGYAAGSDPGGYITPALKKWANNYGRAGGQGTVDVSTFYQNTDERIRVDDLLDDVFFVMTPNENPDGRVSNGRRNYNGFDLNRDGSFQTQSETQNLEPYLAKWNPIIMDELHGFVTNFLIEPCTPPHEQNLEYDLLIENFYKGAEAFGNRALSSVKDTYGAGQAAENGYSLSKYTIPLRDYFSTSSSGWDAWDDLSTSYGPSYAMINCGTLGYTIEIPYNAEGSNDLLVYGILGHGRYMQQNKKSLLFNQLEFFRRGIENIDVTTTPIATNDIEKWYVDDLDDIFDNDLWRPKFTGAGESGKYFPEFYVIPVDTETQRDPADVAAITEYLIRNDVKVATLNKDTVIDGTTYKQGSVIVDMHQGKRNYANAVLWKGIDASFYTGLYSESVVNFPQQRGFTVIPVAKVGLLPAANVTPVTKAVNVPSTLEGKTDNYTAVIIDNNGQEAVRAVNNLLAAGKEVALVTSGADKGNFLVRKDVWTEVSAKFSLKGEAIRRAGGDVYPLKKPTLYLPGFIDDYNGSLNSNPYWTTFFANGFGSKRDIYTRNSGTMEGRNHDRMTYAAQFGFDVTTNPANATIVVGSMAFNTAATNLNGANEQAALNKVLSGTPYISTGASPLAATGPLKTQILNGLEFTAATTGSSESLHHVVFADDSVITAPKKAQGDDIVYNYGGGRILTIPAGASVLYRTGSIANGFHIAGCFPAVSDENLGNKIEAFAYQGRNNNNQTVDVTVFANSLTRKAHQQDDSMLAATTIYLKSIDASKKLEDLSGFETFTVKFSSAGGTKIADRSVIDGTGIVLPTPKRSGYKFLGWYSGKTKVKSPYTVSKNITLTAKWASTNNKLKKLSKSTGTLSPKFKATKTSYTLKISKSKVKVTAAKTSTKAKLQVKVGSGKYKTATSTTVSLKKGKSKTVYFKVVSESGASKVYKVKITRRR